MTYKGTSLTLLVVEAIVVIFLIALAVKLAVVLLIGAALIAAVGVVAFLLWWAWLEFRDRVLRLRP